MIYSSASSKPSDPPAHTTTMNSTELHATMRCMKEYGGSFCSNLADAMLYADPNNRARIIQAFPEIIERYGPTSTFQQRTAAPVA